VLERARQPAKVVPKVHPQPPKRAMEALPSRQHAAASPGAGDWKEF
jgi:hypothetical protein